MSEHFISKADAESDLLSAAAYLAERIKSVDGHADAMAAVVPLYLQKENVDLAAELSNTVDDPFTRDKLLTLVAQKCAALADDEYAVQLADAVEDAGLRAQAFDRVAVCQALRGEFEKAREAMANLDHPDSVLAEIAAQQSARGLYSDAENTISEIAFAGSAVTAYHEMALVAFQKGEAEKAIGFLERASEHAAEIEHPEEKARAYCDIGTGYIEIGRNDKAIESFDEARATAEVIDSVHRDTFLAFAAEGLLRAGSVDLADRALDLVTDKTQIASCLLGYSRIFWKKDEREEAIDSLEEARAILESQHERETRDSKRRFRLFTDIAAQFAGFERGERAIEVAESIKDDEQRIAALTQIASILTVRKEDEQARQALRAIESDGDRVFALLGMSDAKAKGDDKEVAVELLHESAALAETIPQLTLRASAYTEIGNRLDHVAGKGRDDVFIRAVETISGIRDESARVKAIADLAAVTSRQDTAQYAKVALGSI